MDAGKLQKRRLLMGVGWDFYIIVGGSLFIAFLMAYLGWRQKKNDKKNEATS